MYAIIKIGSKQYRVTKDAFIDIDALTHEEGKPVEFEDVLFVGGDEPQVGAPAVSKWVVKGEFVGIVKGPKLQFMKYRPSHHERKSYGHRQKYGRVKITGIEKVKS